MSSETSMGVTKLGVIIDSPICDNCVCKIYFESTCFATIDVVVSLFGLRLTSSHSVFFNTGPGPKYATHKSVIFDLIPSPVMATPFVFYFFVCLLTYL